MANGTPSAVGDGGSQVRLGLRPEQIGQHRPDCRWVQWRQADLRQLLAAPELGPDLPQTVIAGKLVGAVAGCEKQRPFARRVGERGKQVQSGLVRPLQVVNEDHGQPASGSASKY